MAKYRKFITALIAGVLSVLAVLLTAEQFSVAQLVAAGVVAAMGAAGVYVIPNEQPQ